MTLHWSTLPKIWESRVTCGVKMMPVIASCVMVGADIHFRPLQTCIVDIKKWLSHWYAVSRAFGCTLVLLHRPSRPQILYGHSASFVKWKWCRYVIFEADTDIHLRIRYIKCLSHWYAVSRAFWFTHTQLHWPYWPQIWKFWVACQVKMMSLCHV
jgi:hypothetical protein